jgi:hypothetical protein
MLEVGNGKGGCLFLRSRIGNSLVKGDPVLSTEFPKATAGYGLGVKCKMGMIRNLVLLLQTTDSRNSI